jgi:hypothetical protein
MLRLNDQGGLMRSKWKAVVVTVFALAALGALAVAPSATDSSSDPNYQEGYRKGFNEGRATANTATSNSSNSSSSDSGCCGSSS